MNNELPDLTITAQALEEAYAADGSLDFMRDAAVLLRAQRVVPDWQTLSLGGEVAKAATALLNEIAPDTELASIAPLKLALENWAIDSQAPPAPEWSEVLLQLKAVREALTSSDSAEHLANMDAGKALGQAIDMLKALRANQHQGAPAEFAFPSMLNLGWSAGDVIRSITDQGPLYRKPPVSHGNTAALRRIYDLINLNYSHPVSVVLENFRNIKRFSDLLRAVEREFFMVPGEPSDEPEDEGCEPDDKCLVNSWGSSQEKYIEQFRAALLLIAKPTGEPLAHIQFGVADSGEIGDYEIEPNRKVCDALNLADNGNGTIYDLYLFPRQKAAKQ